MSYSDEMSLQFGPDDDEPVEDQEAVIEAFLDGTGRVAVDAAAGTGKTTTMLTTVAETVVRSAAAGEKPFDDILLTTFTTDAASELKTRLKATLRAHVDAGGELGHDVLRHAETDSQIRTIDSLFHELLSEVAIEVGLPNEFELEDGEGLRTVRDEAFEAASREHREAMQRLEAAYPEEPWRSYPPRTVREMVESTQQKCREFCTTPTEAHATLRKNLDDAHGGYTPPASFEEVQTLLETVVYDGAELSVTADDPADREETERRFTEHVRSTYERSSQLVDDFAAVLRTYDSKYDELTRERGTLSYMDTTHLLREFVESNPDHPFVASLRSRFDYVFVDEFQDTSIAQARILKELVRGEETKLLLIGDVKQSIYQWRSADPDLFSDIIAAADDGETGARIPYFDVEDVVYRPLVSNFRSHPDIVTGANHVFENVFADESRGAIGEVDVSYVDVDARSGRRLWDQDTDIAHLHALDLEFEEDSYPNREMTWTPVEAERVAATIDHIVHDDTDSDVSVFEDADERTGAVQTRQAKPGDITLLFRTKSYMQRYADALRERGIDAAPQVSDDLFEQPEVALLVDLLYWFSNPHEEGALLRILRSPLVACSDATLRYLARNEYFLGSLLEAGAWPAELPDDDIERLSSLVGLRDDLRWDREGSKTDLINRILRHSGFDAVVLADEDGLRRYGNLWLLTEVVDSWEEEELLPYREFVDRLSGFRERAAEGRGEPEYEVVDTADPDDEQTVTLTTVHAAKGREFPIVFLCDLLKQANYPRTQHERLVSSRRHGFALRPTPGEPPFPGGVRFDTPDGDDGAGDDAWLHDDRDDGDYPDLTGPVWISDERDEAGQFRYQSPLNEFVRPGASEFWRMFYVAFTRASDHLFVGVTSLPDWASGFTRWTTWMTTLNDFLEPDAGWSSVSGERVTLDLGERTLTVGVDDVPTREQTPRPALELPDFAEFLEREPLNVPETIAYRPLRISPSRIHDLVECPRRYQYQHVQQVAPYYASMIDFDPDGERATGSSSPGGVPPNEWGTAVHEALEAQLEGRDRLAKCVDRFDDELREYVLWVVEAFRRDVDDYRTAYSESPEAYPEYSVSTVLDVGESEVHVTGEVDLLYRVDDEWHVVDYKTSKVPDPDSFKARKYARQLRTYTWVLEREYGIDVSSAALLYIDVDVEAGTVEVERVGASLPADTATYASELRDALQAVDVQSPSGLEATPSDERCGGCPYAASRGGPCEHG